MKHQIVLEGWNCRFRPVTLDDAAFIVNLRNQSFAKGFINDTDSSVDAQKVWLQKYFERPDDYYWIIENMDQCGSVGTNGLYDIVDGECMPGRWVMLPDADIPLPASAYLMFEFIFERLKLQRAVMDVVSSNKKVIRYHHMIGASELSEPPERYREMKSQYEFVWFEFTRRNWYNFKEEWGRRLGPRY